MNGLIKKAIERPVAVLSIIFLIMLFGYAALRSIPIQMSPDIEKPLLQVRVSWPGASPEDVDREIVSRLENELASLKGVEEISSSSSTGQARVSLTYVVGQDMDKATSDLVSQLASVSGLPDDSKQPRVRTSNSDDSPIARMALSLAENSDENAPDLEKLGQFVENEIVSRLGRIEGVAEITFNGGSNYEMRVNVDAVKLSRYQLSVSEVLDALRSSTSLASVGSIDEGKRTYAVRAEAIAYTPQTAANIIVRTEASATGERVAVRLGDVADFQFDTKSRSSFRRLNGNDAVIINALREQGSNVVETMQRLRAEVETLNANILSEKQLQLSVVYDETTYIASAIDLVQQNIWVGGILALTILMLFLRSVMPTIIIFVAVPVSVIGTFVAIAGLGLSINVISLAGLAFAVGMVVDASIVSMENIFRLRQSGLSAPQAAYRGARQVWAPILGSALTTVLVFIPVVSLELPVGQLFKDIGIAISVAVMISVFISVTVIPSLAARLLKGDAQKFSRPFPLFGIDHIARAFSSFIVGYARLAIQRRIIGVMMVGMLLGGSVGLSYLFMPKLDYLPDGNANFVFGRIIVPPGYSMDETLRIAERMEAAAAPLWDKSAEPSGSQPQIERFFFVAYAGGAFAGAAAVEPDRVSDLRPVLMRPVFAEPGVRAFVSQASLFGRSVGGSRSISLNLTGDSLAELTQVARALTTEIDRVFPAADGNQMRVLPSLNANVPQIKITPDLQKLAQSGLSARDFTSAVDVFNDGVTVAQVPINGQLVDLVLSSEQSGRLDLAALEKLPLVTRTGALIQLSQIADVDIVSAPQTIRRLDGKLALSIRLRPIEEIPLENAVLLINTDILPEIDRLAKAQNVSVEVSGAAGELKRTWSAMQTNVLTALGVIVLLLAVLLRSFILPLIIILAIPVAMAGGILGLHLLNLYIRQPLDMLTMLGFVILTGVVVNNAILLVEQTILHISDEAMDVSDAIIEATRNRIRPIFMSTLTSLFGLVPLVIFPGAGSELYRGIGTVVFGGLALSTIATLFIVPPLLSLARSVLVNAGQVVELDDE